MLGEELDRPSYILGRRKEFTHIPALYTMGFVYSTHPAIELPDNTTCLRSPFSPVWDTFPVGYTMVQTPTLFLLCLLLPFTAPTYLQLLLSACAACLPGQTPAPLLCLFHIVLNLCLSALTGSLNSPHLQPLLTFPTCEHTLPGALEGEASLVHAALYLVNPFPIHVTGFLPPVSLYIYYQEVMPVPS